MKKRIVYFDYLRVAAIISVIILHVSSQNWSMFNGRSYTWNVFNFFDSIVRWGVPIFVMISGSLFLSKKVEIEKLYKKNILRMLVSYIVWSMFYAVMTVLFVVPVSNDFGTTLNLIIGNIIGGHFHMWFIPMIIGLYMCVPIIKEIIKSKKIIYYFLSLSFIFSFFIPQLVNILNDFAPDKIAAVVNRINSVIENNMNINMVLGFSFYFILGYLMNEIKLTKKQRIIIYILGVIGFIVTIILNMIVAFKTDLPCSTYYDSFSVNVLLEVIAIHTWFKYKEYKNDKVNSIISKLSKYSFGAYLIHIFVMMILDKFGINTLIVTPIISVPLVALITIIVSFVCSFIINKIPIINRWIV